ncbi:MAG: hypothetical protein ABJF88_07505 [Rhodothermales bacterium]
MLASLLGTRLVLLVGDTVPLPAGPDVVDALETAEVTQDADGRDGFQLTFRVAKGPTLDYPLLQRGTLAPMKRVVVAVALGVVPEVLIDGVITHHQLAPSNEPGGTLLTVTGRDLGTVLDLEEKNAKYPNQPDFLIFSRIIAGYAQYGLVPVPTPTADLPIELERVPRQQETDFTFIQRLAARNGYVFYIEPVTLGVNTAYFGPENRLSLPQRALTMGMGAATNVEQLGFQHDALAPVGTTGTFVEPFLKLALPIPPLPSLKVPPLAAFPSPARRTRLTRETANQTPLKAATTALAAASNTPDAVTGSGTLDGTRYGGVLRARRLVGVRGAGLSYDGFYYVRRVTHRLERGRYTQSFTISREGTGATLPVVVP